MSPGGIPRELAPPLAAPGEFYNGIWLVPCGCGLAGLVLGMVVWRLDGVILLGHEHTSATALIAAIVTASLTFRFRLTVGRPGRTT